MLVKIIITAFLAAMLVACGPEHGQPSGMTSVAKPSVKAVSAPLDLQITAEMMGQVVAETDTSMPAEQDALDLDNSLDLQYKKPESRVKLTGEVYYDEQAADYIEGIEGGKIDVEFKFNG